MASKVVEGKTGSKEYAEQAGKLSLRQEDLANGEASATAASHAHFVTPRDPVIETAGGERLPPVPLSEALKLNALKEDHERNGAVPGEHGNEPTGPEHGDHLGAPPGQDEASVQSDERPGASFRSAVPPSSTHPLFPELPLYGPPSVLRSLQSFGFRCSSSILSLAFLATIVLGSAFTSLPLMFRHIGYRLMLKDPNAHRPFYEEEKIRRKARKEEAKAWKARKRRSSLIAGAATIADEGTGQWNEYEPTEGGKDPLICDIGYYARRVGLDVEEFQVETEDGFILDLWHVYNPKEHMPSSPSSQAARGPFVFARSPHENGQVNHQPVEDTSRKDRRYPVLLVHGLLQSAGAYCTNDDDSLAFFLCKSGYDVWLGNNRCGFKPRHKLLKSTDPRMWNWNIRQMGVMDLPALASRVLHETGFNKVGLICHSQGTTETFVALSKEQRPDLGNKISVFCALAPAVYAGPLIGKMYFKFMRIISPGMFRMLFGIHAFIPFMMTMHSLVPGRLYGAMGYRVFAFLFGWTDDRWDREIRDRFFQFAPVYVSAESMRWWLGRECFATQKCILATREEIKREDDEDQEEEYYMQATEHPTEHGLQGNDNNSPHRTRDAWYDEQVPPFALWVTGSDQLVDGRRLLRRFERGREPHVRVVHTRVIEEYEHLDVLWAMDAIEKVGIEVREVLWKTVPDSDRATCRVPEGCERMISNAT